MYTAVQTISCSLVSYLVRIIRVHGPQGAAMAARVFLLRLSARRLLFYQMLGLSGLETFTAKVRGEPKNDFSIVATRRYWDIDLVQSRRGYI